jgi:hypothetical protein
MISLLPSLRADHISWGAGSPWHRCKQPHPLVPEADDGDAQDPKEYNNYYHIMQFLYLY